jgi:hypothetical protein
MAQSAAISARWVWPTSRTLWMPRSVAALNNSRQSVLACRINPKD